MRVNGDEGHADNDTPALGPRAATLAWKPQTLDTPVLGSWAQPSSQRRPLPNTTGSHLPTGTPSRLRSVDVCSVPLAVCPPNLPNTMTNGFGQHFSDPIHPETMGGN